MTDQRRVAQVIEFMAHAMGCKPAEVNQRFAVDLVRAARRKPAKLKAAATADLEALFR